VQPSGNRSLTDDRSPEETWMSVSTRRPHWAPAAEPTGALNDRYWTLACEGTEIHCSATVRLTLSTVFCAARRLTLPRIVEPPTLTIQSAKSEPRGNVVSMSAVIGSGRSGRWLNLATDGSGSGPCSTQ